MGNAEHFEDAALKAKVPAPDPFSFEILGRKDTVNPGLENKTKNDLYVAERQYRRSLISQVEKNGLDRYFAPEDRARELAHEAIHHPLMNDIPGIDELRKTFDASNPIHLKFKSSLDYGQPNADRLSGFMAPSSHHALSDVEDLPKHLLRVRTITQDQVDAASRGLSENLIPQVGTVPVHTLNHEVSHLLSSQMQQTHHLWPMARTHVYLVNAMMGRDHAEALKRYYTKNGVDF